MKSNNAQGEFKVMKQAKKIIAIGISFGVVLNSLSVSAAEYLPIDQRSEDLEIAMQSEVKTENEDTGEIPTQLIIEDGNTEEIPAQSEETEGTGDAEEPALLEIEIEEVEELSSEPELESETMEESSEESELESEDQGEIAVQSGELLASGTCGENITFKLTKDGVLTLSGSGPMATIEYDWKYYEPKCGWGNQIRNIKKIVVEDGITSISQYSFYDCENLTEVSIPKSVKAIGYEAFHWCPNISKVMIDGLESWCQIDFENDNSNPLKWGGDLYVNGEKKTQIIIPDGIAEIKPYAFCRTWTSEKVVFTSVQLPSTVTSIGEYAFAYNHFTNINIPDSVHKIGNNALAGNDFATIELSENVNTIDSQAFRDCKKLQKIKIPDTVKELGGGLFSGCIKLTNVELPQGIDTIGAAMFGGCTSLERV